MNSKYKHFHRELASWYEAHGRHDLPWRTTTCAYAIYVSEVMLQQTQVKTVLERFYGPFMERFPTLQSLADASEEEVLKYWQGLGYYSRARNLRKAAIAAAPALPDSPDALLALPGIGRNTAHAILAFGFHQPFAVMEANVKRVICRMFALEAPTTAQLWEKAQSLLNPDDPFDYNQAMMDVGAMICTPKTPRCGECPAALVCAGKSSPERYPAPKQRKVVPIRHQRIAIALDAAGKIYCTQRESRFLGGLYGFVELDANATAFTHLGKRYALTEALGSISHTYSHFRLEADVFVVRLAETFNSPEWKTPQELDALPVSKADEKARALLRRALAESAPATGKPTARKASSQR